MNELLEINPQIIKNGKKIEFAVLPYNEFIKMKELAEDYLDLMILREAKSIDENKIGKTPEELLLELGN